MGEAVVGELLGGAAAGDLLQGTVQGVQGDRDAHLQPLRTLLFLLLFFFQFNRHHRDVSVLCGPAQFVKLAVMALANIPSVQFSFTQLNSWLNLSLQGKELLFVTAQLYGCKCTQVTNKQAGKM